MTRERVSPGRLWWALGAVCGAGFVLRVASIGHGLPGVYYHPDEMPILSRALALAKGDPNPHNFLYPSLHFYLLFLWEVLYFVLGLVLGWYRSVADFQAQFFRDPSHLVLVGRVLTAVCGTATLAVVYGLGSRLFDRSIGLSAAVFLAVSPFAVRDAQYVKLDIPVTMFTAIAHLAIARLAVDRATAARPLAWLWAGVIAGLAVSTQYYVVFIAVTFVALATGDAVRIGRWRDAVARVASAGAGMVAGFLAGTPFIVVEMRTAMKDMAGVREVDIDRALADGGGPFTSLPAYMRMLASDAMGWPIAAAAVAGVIVLLLRDWRRGVVLAVFPAAFLAFVAHTVPMSRYLNCVLPLLAVAAAFVVVGIGRRVARAPAIVTLLVGAAALPGLAASVRVDQFFRQADTRTLAHEFIEREIPPDSSILVQPYSAPVNRSRASLVEALRANLGSETRGSLKFQSELEITPPKAPAYRTIYFGDGGTDADKLYVLPQEFTPEAGVTPLRQRNIQYVVLKRANVPNPETRGLELALAAHGRRLATFSPYRADLDDTTRARVRPFTHNSALRIDPELDRPGPIVDVWRVE